MFADIIIDITHEKLDKIFQYSIPSEMEGILSVGRQVVVPFGRGNKPRRGYVIGISDQTDYDPDKIKPVLEIVNEDLAIESKLLELAEWMHRTCGGTMQQALKTVLPIKQTVRMKETRTLRLLLSKEEGEARLAEFERKHQSARARLLLLLLEKPEVSYEKVTKQKITLSVVQALEKQGILQMETGTKYRNPVHANALQGEIKELNKAQKEAAGRVIRDLSAGVSNNYLLHGITGSGKTEVYLEIIEQVLKQGKQVIFLIPEISLTWQMVQRFYRRFGDRISIMNSRLSAGEKYDQMMRARRGEIDIMIGPRSALFTPFPQLGLIILDEEHENSYKSEQTPTYHARETAMERGRIEGASVLLGSATPSLEAYYRARQGEYVLLELNSRAGGGTLSKAHIADMRKEMKEGNLTMFSEVLQELIADRLQKKEQILLFLNRRGYAGFVSCRSCGYVVKCPHCDVALSEHKKGKLVCHYCGFETEPLSVCPSCGSPHIGGFRAGTQQIETLVNKMFPQARVLRMDYDTTRSKDSYDEILSAFSQQKADILIGTQMIVKGHDFPKVTLVGILAADLSLYQADFRASERTFQLLVQAAGRAGRGEVPGDVVIQTYQPENEVILAAAKQDYQGFYEKEITYRDLLGYPPVEHMMAVMMECEKEELLDLGAHYLGEYAKRFSGKHGVQIIGPSVPFVGKVRDYYQKRIFFKHGEEKVLQELKDDLERYIAVNRGFDRIRILFHLNQ